MGLSTRSLGVKLSKVLNSSSKQVVDMRWGVRDEMTDEHMTTVRNLRTYS